jgi:hypothetical protein
MATKAMLGHSLREMGIFKKPRILHVAVKAPTFSYMRIRGADPVLGVEMTSTGEVACMDYSFAKALIKALIASGFELPTFDRSIFVTVRDEDQELVGNIVRNLKDAGFSIMATEGTAEALMRNGIQSKVVGKLEESDEIIRALTSRKIGMVINTPSPTRKRTIDDGYVIRRMATEFQIPVITRMEAALAISSAIREGVSAFLRARPLNEYLEGSFIKLDV